MKLTLRGSRHGPGSKSRPRGRVRSGAAAIEFAVIAPLFFLLIIGFMEFGRAFMVQQILTNASREGSRLAIIEGATVPDVEALVDSYLSNASIDGETVTVNPTTLSTLGFGDPVTVSVTVPYDSVSWLPAPWFLGGKTLAASTTMRSERLQ